MPSPQCYDVLPPRAFQVQRRLEDKLLSGFDQDDFLQQRRPEIYESVQRRVIEYHESAHSLETESSPIWTLQHKWRSIFRRLLEIAQYMELAFAPDRVGQVREDIELREFGWPHGIAEDLWRSPEKPDYSFTNFTMMYTSTSRAAGYNGHNVCPNAASPILGHLTGDCDSKTAFFSAVRVLIPDEPFETGERHLRVCMAANLRRKMQNAYTAGRSDTNGLVEPGFLTHGPQVHVYLAYPDPTGDYGVKVVKVESERLNLCHTRDEAGVWRILRLFRNFFAYATDEGPDGYMGGFLRIILDRLVVRRDNNAAAPEGSSTTPPADATPAAHSDMSADLTPTPPPELPAKSRSPATERVTISLLCN